MVFLSFKQIKIALKFFIIHIQNLFSLKLKQMHDNVLIWHTWLDPVAMQEHLLKLGVAGCLWFWFFGNLCLYLSPNQ